MSKIKELGLVGIGAIATVKEKVRKLIRKGEENEKDFMCKKGDVARKAKAASKEALVISRKSLMMLEKELKKLEMVARKTEKAMKTKPKTKVKKKKRL